MSTIEKVLALSSYELRLLGRSRERLSAVVMLPVFGVLMVNLMSDSGNVAGFAAFAVLVLSSLALSGEQAVGAQSKHLISAKLLHPGAIWLSSMAAALPVLLLQAVAYRLLLGRVCPLDLGTLAWAVGLALAARLAIASSYNR